MLARRAFLAAAVAAAWPRTAHARARKLVEAAQTAGGTTLTFALDAAPFPASAERYRDPTVIAFVPSHFRLPKNGHADVIVHFHGHNSSARAALEAHELREQLVDSKQNALLIVPQGPVRAADSSGGQLDRPHGLRRLLRELLDELRAPDVAKVLGPAALGAVPARGGATSGLVCLSAHSGGYRVLASCLRHGGVDVGEAWLFDALYGELDAYRDWVLAGRAHEGRKRHKLVSYYTAGVVRSRNLELLRELEAAGVACLHERRTGELSRAELVRGRAIFLATPLAHGDATFRHNNLRDCLYASGLRRRLDSDWFDRAERARTIDAR